jgi:hypothetical protein
LSVPEPALAGEPTTLEFAIRYQLPGATGAPGKLVTEFELAHERLLHLVMTSEDLSWFEHQHPVRGDDGLFRLTWRFPRAGKYRMYADFTPADGDNQVVPLELVVGGGGARSVPLVPDQRLAREVGDLRFRLQVRNGPLRMERPALFTYTVTDRHGRRLADMQPFIGAMGHLLAINAEGDQVIHTHSLQAATAESGHAEPGALQVARSMVTRSGPAFSFKLTLPSGGIYRTWAQFARRGRVYTVPFTFAVDELWGTGDRAAAERSEEGVQRATVEIDGRYQPGKISVVAGKPVELTFVRREKVGCGGVVRFPGLRLQKQLEPGESAVVRFTPGRPGRYAFTCGMGMYRGEVTAR